MPQSDDSAHWELFSITLECPDTNGPVTMDEIKAETEKDEVLKLLRPFLENGWPHHIRSVPEALRSFWNVRN